VTASPWRRASLRQNLRTVWRRLRGGEFSPTRFALSLAVGFFIGSLPLYGLHLPLCMAVCLPLRLDVLVAYVAAHVSNPLLAPLLLVLEVNVGSWLLVGRHAVFDVARARETGVSGFVVQAAVGAVVVGAALAVVGAAGGYLLANAFRRRAARRRSVSAPKAPSG